MMGTLVSPLEHFSTRFSTMQNDSRTPTGRNDALVGNAEANVGRVR